MAYKDLSKQREACRKWRANNPEKKRESNRKWHADNTDKVREKCRKWRANNTDKARKYNVKYQLQYKYGLTLEDRNRMLIEQKGKCAICGYLFMKWKEAHVDHNHTTGKVRELLCGPCNTRLGVVENELYWSRALEYLAKHEKAAA